MTITTIWKEIKLNAEEYQQKIRSENIMDKFQAIVYELQNEKHDKFIFLRLIAYLEWCFDKVIEKKVNDKIALNILQNFMFRRKMDWMKDWGILIDDNFKDIETINEIRNDFAHNLYSDESNIFGKIEKLRGYSDPKYEGVNPYDRCLAIVIDVMSIFATSINSGFSYTPTPKSQK